MSEKKKNKKKSLELPSQDLIFLSKDTFFDFVQQLTEKEKQEHLLNTQKDRPTRQKKKISFDIQDKKHK